MKITNKAQQEIVASDAVNRIIDDLKDRGGFDDVWDDCDDDVKDEIRMKWTGIIMLAIEEY